MLNRIFLVLSRVSFVGALALTSGCDLLSAMQPKSACSAARCPSSFENSIGMTMVEIPAGHFMMGNDASVEDMTRLFPAIEKKRLDDLVDERPAHKVNITHAFFMAQKELTVGQFRRFVDVSGYVPESIADGTGGYGYNPAYDPSKTVRQDAFEGRAPRYSWKNPGFAQTDEHPVVNVSWNDAKALAQWLSKTEGRSYRIPTEAEWEYACRAGTQTQYNSGDAPASLSGHANVFDLDTARHWPQWQSVALQEHDGYEFTAPVGQFAPNAFGLYDMHGNVWEWTADWYGDKYYAQSPENDPQGADSGRVRVRRGGSWHTWPLYARCSFRNWNTMTTRYTLVGVRLVMDAPQP